jgi:hypothetical protein
VSVKNHRRRFIDANARLRRGRRLYVFLCRHAVHASTDDSVLIHMSNRMMKAGLYAAHVHLRDDRARAAQSRDYRYRIARWMFNIERGSYGQARPREWTDWLRANGFSWNFHKLCARGQMKDKIAG